MQPQSPWALCNADRPEPANGPHCRLPHDLYMIVLHELSDDRWLHHPTQKAADGMRSSIIKASRPPRPFPP